MSIRTSRWPAGMPCWADLVAPDVDAAKAFYRDVLGWTFYDAEEDGGSSVIAEARGAAAAGIGPQPPDAPNVWTLYFASDDVYKTATAVAENGGTVLVQPGDVGASGRRCIAADPTGAAFGVWQAGTHIGASLVNEPGGLTWEDLRSPDPAAARTFYESLFGYRSDPLAEAGPDYATFALAGEEAPLGGMGGMMGAEGLPAHWLVYFGVTDTPAAVADAERSGGSVIMRDFDTPYGPMAGLADPAGAVFWVIQTSGEDQPDRSG